MATSPNYGWLEPDNTDLVKNGALAIRTLGNAIDTTMATMIPKSIVDAKGDLIAGTAADTAARLAVGANNTVLTADSSTATGLKWVAAASGMTLIQRSTFSSVANTGTTFDGIFTSTYKSYLLVIEKCWAATYTDDLLMQYRYSGTTQAGGYYDNSMKAAAGGTTFQSVSSAGAVNFYTLTSEAGLETQPTTGHLFITNPVDSAAALVMHRGQMTNLGPSFYLNGGLNNTARTYTGLIFSSTSSNISGTIAVYGLATA